MKRKLIFNEIVKWKPCFGSEKEGNEDFDGHVGCFYGTEVFELAGTYIWNQIKDIF